MVEGISNEARRRGARAEEQRPLSAPGVISTILVFFAVFVPHWRSPICCYGSDSMWSIPAAMSIIREGNIDLDEYEEITVTNDLWGELVVRRDDHSAVESIDGHLYTKFPVGTSLVAVPFLFTMDKVSGHLLSLDPDEYIRHIGPGVFERFIASFVVAVAAVFVYLVAHLFLSTKRSLLLVFAFAFCTSSWSTASRALWQHGPSMLMLTITLYLILLAEKKPWLIQFASIPLAFSYVVRPTNSIPVVLLTVFAFIQYGQYFLRYLLWAMIIAIPFLLFNLAVYDAVLSPYYLPQRLGSSNFLEALVGNLVSPARGLFVFSPVLLLSICGIVLKIKDKQFDKVDFFLLGIIFLHWISISSYGHWWAGHSFGPRFFSDMTPYFIYFLIPVLAGIPRLKGMRKAVLASALFCFVVFSLFVHYRGATSWDVHVWNARPVDVDRNPARLWDWHDIQFLRGIEF